MQLQLHLIHQDEIFHIDLCKHILTSLLYNF